MKSFIFSIIIALTFIVGANAQHRFSIQDRVAQLKDSLALTDSQSVAVDSILTNAMEKGRNLDVADSERREAMMQIMTEANKDIEKVLTDDQRVKYESMLAERRSRMQNTPNRENNN